MKSRCYLKCPKVDCRLLRNDDRRLMNDECRLMNDERRLMNDGRKAKGEEFTYLIRIDKLLNGLKSRKFQILIIPK